MKKGVVLISLLLIFIVFVVVLALNKEKIYGIYVYDDILYQSPLSSVSKDFLLDEIDDYKITIKRDMFKIDDSKNVIQIIDVIYKKEKMDMGMENKFSKAVINSVTLSEYKNKYQYTILKSNNSKTNILLFQMDDEIWLASINNKGNNGYNIMYMYKLKKYHDKK